MNKVFSLFLMVALILGGSLGGAFAGGVALGKTQREEPSGAQRAGNFSQGQADRSQGREQRAGPGGQRQRGGQGAGPEGGAQRAGQGGPDSSGPRVDGDGRQGFEGPRDGAEGGERRGQGGRDGVGGAIESIDGNTLTITTPRGPVTVNTYEETTVRKIVDGTMEDLTQGVQIRVTGARDEEGTVKATSITLVPEGAQEFFGRRGPRQER